MTTDLDSQDRYGSNECREDTQHLQGLPSLLVQQADVWLCVWEEGQIFAFPAHKTIIAAHSSVLSDLIHSALKPQDWQLPRLPMMDDSCAAVRTALACIYSNFPQDPSDAPPLAIVEPEVSLEFAAAHISHMKFYDKYDMRQVAKVQTKALMEPLQECLSATQLDDASAAHVLQCAVAAEHCKLEAMLGLCEAIVIEQFPVFVRNLNEMTSQLSSSSMFRIGQARINMVNDKAASLVHSAETLITKMDATLDNSAKEAQSFCTTVRSAVRACTQCSKELRCPRCNGSLMLAPPSSTVQLCHMRQCQCSMLCKWPDQTSFSEQINVTKEAMQQHLATLRSMWAE